MRINTASVMQGNIFVSYRREDSKHAAGRLVDRLQTRFRPDQLFIDVDNIELGLDFVDELNRRVAECDVMLVVIGPQWLNARDDDGNPRLRDPRDFVRLEVEAALNRDIRVIPVLVDGAEPVSPEDLPPSMAPLANRQATTLAHESFSADAERLTRALIRIATEEPKPETKAIRQSAPPETQAGDPSRSGGFFDFSTDPIGWFAALSPALSGAVLTLLILIFGLSPSAFNWFGLPGDTVAGLLPVVFTGFCWAVRLTLPYRVTAKPLIVGACLLAANLYFAIFLLM